ncbi:hypothetical protein SCALM49S_00358 [Streptomyces californicus]
MVGQRLGPRGPAATSLRNASIPASRSAPGSSTRPSVYSTNVSPGTRSSRVSGYSSSKRSVEVPSGSPPRT